MGRLNYEVREFVPSYRIPRRLTNEWRSPSTGLLLREAADLDDLDLHALATIGTELVIEITNLRAQRGATVASMQTAGRSQKEINKEVARINNRRAFLSGLSNSVKSRLQQARWKAPRPWSAFFVDACREQLEPEVFRRLERLAYRLVEEEAA